jgi:hypothetical protein
MKQQQQEQETVAAVEAPFPSTRVPAVRRRCLFAAAARDSNDQRTKRFAQRARWPRRQTRPRSRQPFGDSKETSSIVASRTTRQTMTARTMAREKDRDTIDACFLLRVTRIQQSTKRENGSNWRGARIDLPAYDHKILLVTTASPQRLNSAYAPAAAFSSTYSAS